MPGYYPSHSSTSGPGTAGGLSNRCEPREGMVEPRADLTVQDHSLGQQGEYRRQELNEPDSAGNKNLPTGARQAAGFLERSRNSEAGGSRLAADSRTASVILGGFAKSELTRMFYVRL